MGWEFVHAWVENPPYMVRERRSVMRRRNWKRVGIVVGLLLVWVVVGVLLRRFEALPSFRFLEGREVSLRWQEEERGQYPCRIRREVYSFEADANDVCPAAHEELLAAGFVEEEDDIGPDWLGRYYRRPVSVDEVLVVRVFDRHKPFEGPLAAGVTYGVREGWVTIEVSRERRSGWRDVVGGVVRWTGRVIERW